ncbi:MAG: hypothetical protein ACFFG0_02665 [Candidatus Thorarchaeota archaeon]
MSKAKDEYYDGSEYEDNAADRYISELEQQNEEMLELIMKIENSTNGFNYAPIDYVNLRCRKIIEKITGISIDEVIG